MTFDPDAAAAPGSGIFGLSGDGESSQVVLIPVPFDATTSYRDGSHAGPEAILEGSLQVDLFDLDTGKPYEHGIALADVDENISRWNSEARALALPIIESGGTRATEGLVQINALCDRMNESVYASAKHWLHKTKLVGIIGGDHSTVFGSIKAHAEMYPSMGVLHVDAHADLRQAYEGFTWSHASIMYNVMERLPAVSKLVQVGIRDFGEAEFDFIEASNGRIHTFFDARLAKARLEGMSWKEQVDSIVSQLPKQVYISWDIDGLDPTLCPNTGTPVPGGLSFSQAQMLLEGLVRAKKTIVGFDVNEVAPGDSHPGWDGNVGARLLYKIIGYALLSR